MILVNMNRNRSAVFSKWFENKSIVARHTSSLVEEDESTSVDNNDDGEIVNEASFTFPIFSGEGQLNY